MRWLIGLAAVLAALWSGWWAFAGWAAERAARQAVAAEIAAGGTASLGTVTRSGFPTRIALLAENASFAQDGWTVTAPALSLSTPTAWPADVTLALQDAPLRLTGPAGPITLDAPGASARVRLMPHPDLPLDLVQATSGPWSVTTPAFRLSADALSFSFTEDTAPRYRLDLSIADLTPPVLALQIADRPDSFDAFALSGALTFAAPLDRHAQDAMPRLRGLVISGLDIAWGPQRLTGMGALTVDATGLPSGTLSLSLTNWRGALDLAARLGALPPEQTQQMGFLLAALARQSGDPETLDLDLIFKDGRMAMGPIDLGPAPRLPGY